MESAAETPAAADDRFTEKEFYLEEFRGRTLLVAVRDAALRSDRSLSRLTSLAADLLPNDTRLLLLVGAPDAAAAEEELSVLRKRPWPLWGADAAPSLFPELEASWKHFPVFRVLEAAPTSETLAQVWEVLRWTRLCIAVVPSPGAPMAQFAAHLAARLRVHKLVLAGEEGGVAGANGHMLSFMDAAMLDALLRPGEAEQAGVSHRRPTLEAIRDALDEGVAAVNLCSLEGLARELFTYEGSGTLFTREDYCRVAPLGIDDSEEVERLIERGQREGFLKPRSPEEIFQIVLHGYGATIGGHHLAGICGLHTEPYAAEAAGEIVALYTLTRFKGEGVGRKLLAHLEQIARRRKLRYMFACTSEARAQSFFERCGFRRVTPDDVPAAKWENYDRGRVRKVAVYRLDLDAGEGRAS